jgi:protein SCO1
MATLPFDRATPAEDIAAFVDSIRRDPGKQDLLMAMLVEESPIYAGRGTAEAERLRGYLLASFEIAGLPPAALPYVLEELETGINPYTVAAAARALRGSVQCPGAAPSLILAAIRRLKLSDDSVSFESFSLDSHGKADVTMLVELIRTLARFGGQGRSVQGSLEKMLRRDAAVFSPSVRHELKRAIDALSEPPALVEFDCCGSALSAVSSTGAAAAAPSCSDIADLQLQDQDGTLLTFGAAFFGRPGALAFFYTRCMNPEKCSRTITMLARLQSRLIQRNLQNRVNLAAITYDPAFDRPASLRAYGADRGVRFDAHTRLMRTTGPFEPLRQHFDLGVGFGPVTVNRHRLDLVMIDDAGNVTKRFARRQWHEEEVLGALSANLQPAAAVPDGTRKVAGRKG